MDESELNKQLVDIKKFIGTFASDELKSVKICFYPTFLIINLDERSGTGTHWIAMAIYQNNIYVCDPLGGIQPSATIPADFVNFLHLISEKRSLCLTRQLQHSDSDTCGLYCVTFVREMARLNCFSEFIRLFTSNLQQNDKLITFLNSRK